MAMYALFTNGGQLDAARAALGEKEKKPTNNYDFLNNPIAHLSATIAKCMAFIATKDWSHRPEMEAAYLRLELDQFYGDRFAAGVGRVCGARAGAVVSVCAQLARTRTSRAGSAESVPHARPERALPPLLAASVAQNCWSIWYWHSPIVQILDRLKLENVKLSGSQSYMLYGLQHPLVLAALKAKGLVARLTYVPVLDAIQRVEGSGEAATLCAYMCQDMLGWLVWASTPEGAEAVMRGEARPFEENVPDAEFLALLRDIAWPERRGKHTTVWVYDENVKRFLMEAFAAVAKTWHRHSVRWQAEPCPLAPDDSQWRAHGGELSSLTGERARAANNASLTGCGAESAMGLTQYKFRLANAQNVHNRSAWSIAASCRVGTKAFAEWSKEVRVIRWLLAKRVAKWKGQNLGTETERLRRLAFADKAERDERAAKKLRQIDAAEAELGRLIALAPVTRVSAILTMNSSQLLDQLMIFKKVFKAQVFLGKDGKNWGDRMRCLARLVRDKYGDQVAMEGCTDDKLRTTAEGSVSCYRVDCLCVVNLGCHSRPSACSPDTPRTLRPLSARAGYQSTPKGIEWAAPRSQGGWEGAVGVGGHPGS